MSWTRRSLTALAVCVLLLTGSVGCGSSGAGGDKNGDSPSPVGQVLGDRDDQGQPYREVDEEDAPEVRIEVQPDAGGAGWDVRLGLRNFRFSPPGTPERAAPGRGFARLYLDGSPVAELRDPAHRLAADRVTRGTHQVTARLYADDGTVWAVDGEPVERTADITASGAESAGSRPTGAGGDPAPRPTGAGGDPARSRPPGPGEAAAGSRPTGSGVSSAPGSVRTQGRGSPDPGGRAS
jgi:hypothetical protein